mmetsp:Transcript_5890/g.18453  ORF Transcript_5890/g.18453 Transcript_5890/m.18453 type:complete len:85 (+) Transcript_5890:1759-2013(+)
MFDPLADLSNREKGTQFRPVVTHVCGAQLSVCIQVSLGWTFKATDLRLDLTFAKMDAMPASISSEESKTWPPMAPPTYDSSLDT